VRKQKYFIVKLSNGKFMGNLIDGPRTNLFVEVEERYAVRFHSRRYANIAAGNKSIVGFTIEETEVL
jgi:hypothetical protein